MSVLTLLSFFLMTFTANAVAFDSGSTGADGVFNPNSSITVQVPESGVFNYTTVNIPTGVTVTYKKNEANTPVTILASGNVTISGTVSVSGSSAGASVPGYGGPGGFDGGRGGSTSNAGLRGQGPGAGVGGLPRTDADLGGGFGGGGGFGFVGNTGTGLDAGAGGTVYGNDRLIPLIGGSGGGGGGGNTGYPGGGGGGGGGSILIASSGTITVTGAINANGGNGASSSFARGSTGGGGSGGSVRLIANTIAGNGSISATGSIAGTNNFNNTDGSLGSGGNGRIRLECTTMTRTNPTTPAYTTGTPSPVVPTAFPTLSITSIAGISVTGITKGSTDTPDIYLPYGTTSPVSVVVTGTNLPVGSRTVTVKAVPATGTVTSVSTTFDDTLSASVSLPISTTNPSVITASVTFQMTASNGGPLYAQGERVDWVRVSANLGSKSTVTYITESGREIPVAM